MTINSLYHDTGSKTMPDDTVLPANADGMVTISNAVSWLSDHPNTAPFISRRLIQFLVTSNPSPAYIQRVTTVFANDGSGVRGNLGAVVKAVLLDPEARGLNYLNDPNFGRLKEPMLRLTNTARVLEAGKAAGPATDLSSFQYWNFPGVSEPPQSWSWSQFCSSAKKESPPSMPTVYAISIAARTNRLAMRSLTSDPIPHPFTPTGPKRVGLPRPEALSKTQFARP